MLWHFRPVCVNRIGMNEMKATTKRQAKVSQDNETELRRWCVEMAIRWPVQGGSGGFASGSYIPTVAVDADVLGRAKKLLEWIKAR